MNCAEINYTTKEQKYFLGRNGTFKAKGIYVYKLVNPKDQDDDIFMIQPITSKDNIGRAKIEIGRKDVPRLIELLQGLLAQ